MAGGNWVNWQSLMSSLCQIITKGKLLWDFQEKWGMVETSETLLWYTIPSNCISPHHNYLRLSLVPRMRFLRCRSLLLPEILQLPFRHRYCKLLLLITYLPNSSNASSSIESSGGKEKIKINTSQSEFFKWRVFCNHLEEVLNVSFM